MPVVDANESGSAITLSAAGIILDGFNAIRSGSYPNAGIMVLSDNNTLSNNSVSNNGDDGISLHSSSNNILIGNNVSNNYYGIYLYLSNNNTLNDNILDSNNGDGIQLESSSNNTLNGNNASNNYYNGITMYSSLSLI